MATKSNFNISNHSLLSSPTPIIIPCILYCHPELVSGSQKLKTPAGNGSDVYAFSTGSNSQGNTSQRPGSFGAAGKSSSAAGSLLNRTAIFARGYFSFK